MNKHENTVNLLPPTGKHTAFRRTNTHLFEACLQALLREATRIYGNLNQTSWSQDFICSEWWPPQPTSFAIGSLFGPPVFSLTILDTGPDPLARIQCGGSLIQVEFSGKRIGMYGPWEPMSDTEILNWFNASIDALLEVDRGWYQKRFHIQTKANEDL